MMQRSKVTLLLATIFFTNDVAQALKSPDPAQRMQGSDLFMNAGDGLAAAAQGLVAAAQGQHSEIQNFRAEMIKALEGKASISEIREILKNQEQKGGFMKEMEHLEENRSKNEMKHLNQMLVEMGKWWHQEEQKKQEQEFNASKQKSDYEQKARKDTELGLLADKHSNDMKLAKEKEDAEKALLQTKIASEDKQKKAQIDEQLKEKQLDAEMAQKVAKVKADSEIQAERVNEDVRTRQIKVGEEEKRKTTLASIDSAIDKFFYWMSGLTRVHLYGLLASIVFVFAGFFFSKEFAILTRQLFNKWFALPTLVRTTSYKSTANVLFDRFQEQLHRKLPPFCLPPFLRKSSLVDANVILPESISASLVRLANGTKSARQTGMPLRHLMFHGPPGTGKTMMAKRFAEYSGLDYAIMSGGDVAPLGEQAVTEIHALMKWAQVSPKGLVLFIDEADAFLRSRKSPAMSENLRNSLNTLLYHTGTPNNHFMMIIVTNRPGDLDAAILDRIDEKLEFGLPDLPERVALVELYYDEYITKFLKKGGSGCGDVDSECLRKVAGSLEGFSGREITKLMGALQMYLVEGGPMTRKILFDVVGLKVAEHNTTAEFARGVNW